MARVRAHRVTYVGELGWEIYVPTDLARHVFDQIMDRGHDFDLQLAGLHAMDSCRMEKAFRHFGHDISDEDHVLEAGLGFAVKIDKPTGRFGDFLGRSGVVQKKQTGLSKRLVQFKLTSPEPILFHNEPIWRDNKIAGYLTSGAYGHALGAAVGLGYVACGPDEKPGDVVASRYEIEIAGDRTPAIASLKPLYDPQSERVKV
jgi:glycine cleavage system aminomethyltransferase T